MFERSLDERVAELWDWISVALFLLITVDMLTTVYAAHLYGPSAEANPFMQWLLQRGWDELVLTNLAAAGVSIGIFYGLIQTIENSRPPFSTLLAICVELWVGLLCSAGLAVFANNLSVIVYGQSLF